MNEEKPKNKSAALRQLRGAWPLLMRHRGLLIGWLVALAISSAATLTFPLAFGYMIDHGLTKGTGVGIHTAFAALLIVSVILAVATGVRFFFVSLLGERVVAGLRNDLYSHLIGMDLGFHDRHRSGDLTSRLTADAEILRSMVGSTMSVALRSLVTVLGSLTLLFVTSPRLASIAMIGIPLAVLPIVFGGRRLDAISRQSQDRIGDANALASEKLSAISTVQSNAMETYERSRYKEAMDSAVNTARRRIKTQSALTAIAMVLIFGSITGVLWLGAMDVAAGRMTGGTLGQFVMYALIGGGSVGALAEVWNELQKAGGGMSRISELIDTDSVIENNDGETLSPAIGQIEFDNVLFEYPNRKNAPALRDFSLSTKPGERIALVGPSGAGKSTVLSLLLRFYDPAQGRILVDGKDIKTLNLNSLRENIALVPQSPTLFATSVRENIRYGRLEATDDEVLDAARAANALDFIEAMPEGLDTELGERGARLSGGQQQRIAIARALLKNAPILLLDEATSALDAQSEHMVQSALETLMQGRTSLVIAHRLATVRQADRIVVMDQGRIVAEGTHDSLLDEGGLYAELAKLQFID